MNGRFVLAHLSDTHLDGHERNAARATQVLDYLNGLPTPVDAIIVTGDITDNGLPAEVAQADKILRSHLPLFTCPGNHDGYTPYDWPRNEVHDVAGVRLAMCDSVVPGRNHGELAAQTVSWLKGVLKDTPAGTPVLIAFHHPPLVLHHDLIDEINLDEPSQRALAELIEAHPQVVALLVGHAHTAAAGTFAGRPVLVAPGVTSTLLLPWEVPGEFSFKSSVDYAQPPALAFHILDDRGRLTTHFRFLPD